MELDAQRQDYASHVGNTVPESTIDLTNAIDKYLKKREEEMHPQDMELIIRLRDFILNQNRIMDDLLDQRKRLLLQRQE